ncbi:hypothetical protein [Ekhidna sp. To15]|uniref:hypothetical protein n=1 Tax=Ekhidna sp. To15 TaxID=3395267 RepID=UPI003F51FF80
MNIRASFSVLILTILIGCAPLSKSQLKLSHNYFQTIANHPRYIQELNIRVADLNLEAKNLESSLHNSDSLRIATIIHSINEYEESMRIPDSILVHTKVLDKYIQSYYLLIPNGFSIYRALKGTTETIGGIFGLGGVVSGILPSNVNGLNPTKKRKIQTHVLSSEPDLINSLNKLKAYINSSYLPRLEAIDKQSISDFELLLESINNKTPPLEYYTRHNRMLTDFYQRLYHTKNLVSHLSKSIDNFMIVEKEISQSFQEKEKINVEETHLNELVDEMHRINFILHDLNERKMIKAN